MEEDYLQWRLRHLQNVHRDLDRRGRMLNLAGLLIVTGLVVWGLTLLLTDLDLDDGALVLLVPTGGMMGLTYGVGIGATVQKAHVAREIDGIRAYMETGAWPADP